MRALCVGRHRLLSDHLRTYVEGLGLETAAAIGMEEAAALARETSPDVVICDHDLLATRPLGVWESDERLARVPIVAVSLTRRPDDVHLLDVNGIGGFLYLPTLSREAALRVVGVPRCSDRVASLPWGGTAGSPTR
ncbi:MAG: hypothetical protein NVS9B3_07730 [Gemmatimonadaceae bacterium]